MWLGNATRNFYGTGPWKAGQLKVIWELKTDWISGRLHKDPWGGASWPGQPSIKNDRVYFASIRWTAKQFGNHGLAPIQIRRPQSSTVLFTLLPKTASCGATGKKPASWFGNS